MSNEKLLEEQQMDSDSDEYEDEVNYEKSKQEGETKNATIQQSMKHFQPTNKILSKYVEQIFDYIIKSFF
jgi:hypothetical protein